MRGNSKGSMTRPILH